MSELSAVKRAADLTDGQIRDAVGSREATKALLEHMSVISKPGEGASRLLLLFAEMAMAERDWLDGDLRVELVGDGQVTVVEVLTELGGGLRERALAPVALQVPLAEFIVAVDATPSLTAPLTAVAKTERRVVFAHPYDSPMQRGTLPPQLVSIAPGSLSEPRPYPASAPPMAPAPVSVFVPALPRVGLRGTPALFELDLEEGDETGPRSR